MKIMESYQQLPTKVTIFEVGPRDGLQNELEFIPTEKKIELINRLSEAGCERIEIGSFAHPKWVPQLKDIKDVNKNICKADGVAYSAFIPNLKGLELAMTEGITEVVTIISASESHNKKNLNRSIAESLDDLKKICDKASQNNINVRCYIGTSFGCPIEGNVTAEQVVELATQMEGYGVYEISLGDTTGMANPILAYYICEKVLGNIKQASVAAHFHQSQGIEFANVLAVLQAGITVFDGSAGGLGGCPYAPGATGNIATEKLVELFDRMDITTGIDKEKIKICSQFAQQLSANQNFRSVE